MRSVHSTGSSQAEITGSARKHIISRFTKAAVNTMHLVTLLKIKSDSGATDADILEVKAYVASLKGAAEFERRAWNSCLRVCSEARIIYTILSNSTNNDLFGDFQENTIDPMIRYAAYKCQLPRTTSILTIARQYFPRSDPELVNAIDSIDAEALEEMPTSSGDAAKIHQNLPKTISWRSRTVKLEDASIATALASVNEAASTLMNFLSGSSSQKKTRKERAAAYDDVLIACQDAVDSTKHALEQAADDGLDQSDPRAQGLQVTRTAVNYMLVGWRVGRNRILDGELLDEEQSQDSSASKTTSTGRILSSLRERVALYDANMQVSFLHSLIINHR